MNPCVIPSYDIRAVIPFPSHIPEPEVLLNWTFVSSISDDKCFEYPSYDGVTESENIKTRKVPVKNNGKV
jgi:hypothetical protein